MPSVQANTMTSDPDKIIQAIRWLYRPALFLVCLIPFALLAWRTIEGDLGANPVEYITRYTGDWSLRFLMITLALTPLRMLTGIGKLLRFRRMLGLFAFFYVCLHFSTYVWLDRELDLSTVITDVIKRPYITVGFTAFLLLIPMAITSTNKMIKRLGRNWAKLHKAIYIIGALGVLHYLWLVKADVREPIIYAVILIVLLGFRAVKQRRALKH
ncbi:MAG: hypothetical protein BMS9Abin26_0676 [Gammaproteobacteria bacterium]|nr:MAG: hypothetical protein BMS9Abin26_0676 [Gammaproteobacteria bacterium]